ncbi:MAG: hypothetical protein IKX23_06865 [Treponema sp.]|nr:hypothetical protein [Treponema sp.]
MKKIINVLAGLIAAAMLCSAFTSCKKDTDAKTKAYFVSQNSPEAMDFCDDNYVYFYSLGLDIGVREADAEAELESKAKYSVSAGNFDNGTVVLSDWKIWNAQEQKWEDPSSLRAASLPEAEYDDETETTTIYIVDGSYDYYGSIFARIK